MSRIVGIGRRRGKLHSGLAGLASVHAAARQTRRRIIRPLVVMLLSWPLVSPVLAEDMSPAVSEHVRRATVMVLMEIPGTRGGGSGTGEFINENGLLITNNHVIDPNHGKSREQRAKDFRRVTLPKYKVIVDSGTPQEKTWDAELLYQSEPTDLALLELKEDEKGRKPRTPHYLALSPEGTLREGLKMWVFGFPGGLSRGSEVAITFGLITKLIRSRSGLIHYVESDATVHPGNSGGPFVDVNGYLIGVATHKRFEEREKDRSGAVPVRMVEDFIRNAFYEDRVPRTADVLPFVDIFTNQDGIVEFPHYPRDAEQCMVYSAARDQVRRGKLLDASLDVDTRLGPLGADVNRAAYLLVYDRIATLIMDGGDYLTFSYGAVTLPFDFSGRKENVPVRHLALVAFPRHTDVVKYPRRRGVIVEADLTRLGLAQIEGTLSMGGAAYELANVASIESQDRGKQILATNDGQRLPGKLGAETVRARTTWSSEPVAIRFDRVQRATVRPIDWTFVNAKGRRLAKLIEFEDDDLGEMAALLDSPDWAQATGLLKKARSAGRRGREAKRQLKLLQGVEKVRSGDHKEALATFRGLRSASDQVRWTAACYLKLLEEHPDGKFRDEPLSDPDVFWRASTYLARKMLRDARERFEKARELDYDKNVKELKKIEGDLETANRLELGIAQSLLMDVLRAEYEAHYYGYQQTVNEYNRVVREHNSQRFRAQQAKYGRKLKSLEKKIEKAIAEARRAYERLNADVTGFVVEPPKFDRHRR